MQEFKRNLLNLVEQYRFASGDVQDAMNRRARDMDRELIECRAKCDDLRSQIKKEIARITSIASASQYTYKANIYGPSFVIDQVDIEGNRETVVHLKEGMQFKPSNNDFTKLTGMNIESVKNVCVFACYEIEAFDPKRVEQGKMWIVCDEYDQVLKIVDLT